MAINMLWKILFPPSDKAIKNISKELGLNKPLIVQYGDWIGKAIKLNFRKEQEVLVA